MTLFLLRSACCFPPLSPLPTHTRNASISCLRLRERLVIARHRLNKRKTKKYVSTYDLRIPIHLFASFLRGSNAIPNADVRSNTLDDVLTRWRHRFLYQTQVWQCCTRSDHASVKDSVAAAVKGSSNEAGACAAMHRTVLCGQCHPYAAHIYDAESEDGYSRPGLTSDYCKKYVVGHK